jgi:hypothetical protein
MKKLSLFIVLVLVSLNCFSWSNEEIENVLGNFISRNYFFSTVLKWSEIFSLARQTLLRRLALSENNPTYYNVATRVIDPKIIIFSLNQNNDTVIGGNTSQIMIYIAQYERGTYLQFLVAGSNPDDPEDWYDSYEHEIMFTKDQQRGWQTIRTNLTDIRNEINTDFLTIVRPRIILGITDNNIRPWNIMDEFFTER